MNKKCPCGGYEILEYPARVTKEVVVVLRVSSPGSLEAIAEVTRWLRNECDTPGSIVNVSVHDVPPLEA